MRAISILGVLAFDSSPEGVIATEMRRDADRILEEDSFQLILDTFMDSRSAYMFVVNPLGAQLDQQVFDEGRARRARDKRLGDQSRLGRGLVRFRETNAGRMGGGDRDPDGDAQLP